MKLNYIFEKGGNKNNQITLEKSTSPKNCKTTDIEKERKYLLEFNNVKQNLIQIKLKGELINYCEGDWKCDLTDEQIEKEIPENYGNQKEELRKIAKKIIKNNDREYQSNIESISVVAKIGKWVSKNIIYTYDDEEAIELTSPLEIYQKKKMIVNNIQYYLMLYYIRLDINVFMFLDLLFKIKIILMKEMLMLGLQ